MSRKPRSGRTVRFALPEDVQPSKDQKPESHVEKLIRLNKQSARDMFLPNYGMEIPPFKESSNLALMIKISDEYSQVRDLPLIPIGTTKIKRSDKLKGNDISNPINNINFNSIKEPNKTNTTELSDEIKENIIRNPENTIENVVENLPITKIQTSTSLLTRRQIPPEYSVDAGQLALLRKRYPKPKWHSPWKLKTVLSAHLGWVRSVAVDPANEQFVTGSNDRTIKIWDLASGSLKLTLTGHINAVTGLAISDRHPYMFSVGDDKIVRCWDLEQNKTIRSYHGHLSGVYGVSIHPIIDVIVTCGRDSSARIWDMRTKAQIHILTGHTNTIASVKTQSSDPQIITGSHDTTVRLWDIRNGRATAVLTNHKKSVRDLAVHQKEFTFSSASADNLKVQKFPNGEFLRNMSGVNSIINTLSLNSEENILVSGGDEGTLKFQDWKTSYCFQSIKAPPQPGSLDSECGIFASTFDVTGTRLITAEADKTIKIWQEDEDATPETHPVDYQPPKKRKRY